MTEKYRKLNLLKKTRYQCESFLTDFFKPYQCVSFRQGTNASKVNWGCVFYIETSSLWAEFVIKNRCISVRLVSEEVKSI